eukprot:TRINITY_DN68986_c0_g1_i1.p1 TRINITY_DN68986_c0_g1~~TRINITY_DN68986_c0_g1_i1.p1  ORF type:complete len:387 (-),score=75.86 TRINITY_DN68986_c0_g1_i1:72-1100(-)
MKAVQKAQMMMNGMDWEMKCPTWLWSENPQEWKVGTKWPEQWDLPETPNKDAESDLPPLIDGNEAKRHAKVRLQQNRRASEPDVNPPEEVDEMATWSDEQKMWWSDRVYEKKSECEQLHAKVPVLAAMGNIYKIKTMKKWSAWNAVALKIYQDGMACAESNAPEPEVVRQSKVNTQELPNWTVEETNMFLDWHKDFVCNLGMMTDIRVVYGPSPMDKMRSDNYGKRGFSPSDTEGGEEDTSPARGDEWEVDNKESGEVSKRTNEDDKNGGESTMENDKTEMCGETLKVSIEELKSKVTNIEKTMSAVQTVVKSVKQAVVTPKTKKDQPEKPKKTNDKPSGGK